MKKLLHNLQKCGVNLQKQGKLLVHYDELSSGGIGIVGVETSLYLVTS